MSDKSNEIKAWFKEHPFFKIAPLCSAIGLDKGNFTRIINSANQHIPEKHISKIEEVLKNYGYQPKVQVRDLTKPTGVLKPQEQPKTNYSISTIPKTLDELKRLCPEELKGFERSTWIATERQKYGI